MATAPYDADVPSLGRMARGWDRFWFGRTDPTTLGLIRICTGLVVLYVQLVYTLDLQQLCGKNALLDLKAMNALRHDEPVVVPPDSYEPQMKPLPQPSPEEAKSIEKYIDTWGVDPRLAYARGQSVWSVWFHVTDPGWMLFLHVCVLLAVLLFTVGFCTRVTAVLTWVGVMSYIQRTPTTLFGMDAIMAVLLFYLMIGPAGAALSVDRLLARWWARRQAERAGRPVPAWAPPAPSATANFALRLMQIHFCFIYLASGASKLQGAAWWNGSALWGTWANYEFAPLDWARYVDFLRLLASHRWLCELATGGGVAFTLALEIGLPFLVWLRPLRWVMLCGSVLMHVGIALNMGLTTFSLLMISLVLAFVPGTTARHWLSQLPFVGQWLRPAPVLEHALPPPMGRKGREALAGSVAIQR
jgi:hypothetical protein